MREESQHKHLLRSRLVWVWEGGIKSMIEPLQAVVAEYPSIFKSAMRVGDVVRIDEYTMHLYTLYYDKLTLNFVLLRQQNAMFCR